MSLPIQLISTDFDGTLHAEFETPQVPLDLQKLIGSLQAQGARWVINTGRDMTGVMEGMARAGLTIRPDYLVVVERHIYQLEGNHYRALVEWNRGCEEAHSELFSRVRQDVDQLVSWISSRFRVTLYEDEYSPFCVIADTDANAEAIHAYLDGYCARTPGLMVVRNSLYARFSHAGFNKGTSLQEIARRLNIAREHIFAVGDHLNDLPMLDQEVAGCLAAPDNAIDEVKEVVRQQTGYVSHQPWGHGVARSLEFFLEKAGH